MAQIENVAFQRQWKSFSHRPTRMIRIDMTPMVDLGFLLITFFIFTTTISTPTITNLYMPDTNPDPHPPKLDDELALTILLDANNRIYYYNGNWEDAKKTEQIFETTYSEYAGFGKVIRQKQEMIEASGKFSEGKKGMMVLIKPGSRSAYKNIMDALDEMTINDVRKFAIIDPDNEEIEFLKTRSASGQ
jgi:biopolymer transport protein ExbD